MANINSHERDQIYANALNIIPELGPVKLTKLIKGFGSFEQAWLALPKDLQQINLDEKTIKIMEIKRPHIDPLEEFTKLKKNGITILLETNDNYPKFLKEISSPPPILYTRGNIKALNTLAIGVVGTRLISLYGKQVTIEIVTSLVQNNLSIVSGLAFGTDSEALNTCVNNKGTPIAVLASPIDNNSISPRANFNLAQKVIQTGCLISEYPLGAPVQKQNFPIRNRIISGLCAGVLVVEADIESGALITANYALEQNREVFAIPGSIFSPTSRGTNTLIQKGAKLVISTADILSELNLDAQTIEFEEQHEEDPAQQELLGYISREPKHLEDIIRESKMPAKQLMPLLTMLEMKGRIKNLGGGKYVKTR
jgi:DNA processing protein